MAKKRSTQSSLPEAKPSAPARPGKYVLYIDHREQSWVIIWCTAYAAKKFMDAILEEDDYILESKNLLKAKSGMKVRTEFGDVTIKDIMAHKYTKAEAEWGLPHSYDRTAHFIRTGSKPSTPKRTEPQRELRPKRERKPRASREGLITVQQLAEELSMKPRDARAKLRKAKIDKPDAGWAWSPDDADDIRSILRA